jgi:hypothetical protein
MKNLFVTIKSGLEINHVPTAKRESAYQNRYNSLSGITQNPSGI